jgi:transposase
MSILLMPAPFKTDPIDFSQHQLFPSNLFDLLPEDHDCYLFRDLLQQLDTRSVEALYSVKGQNAYHPKNIISILIYGYSHGVFSSRQLEKRCKEDLSFMYIAGQHCPNFRVLSDFRQRHATFFRECFKQTVRLAMEMKLASLGHVSLDGSKFKANSSKHKAMSYQHLKKKEQALGQEIDALLKQASTCDKEEDAAYKDKTGYELPEDLAFKQQRLSVIKAAKAALEAREEALNPGKPIEDKKQISFADHDARIMGKKGDFDYRYNGQISVDSDNQIIVGEHLSQHANDKQEVKEGLQRIKESTGVLPEKMSLDNGYQSGDNLAVLEQANVDAYIAVDRGEKYDSEALNSSNRPLVKADFIYDEQADCFACPGGERLTLKKTDKNDRRVYQGDIEKCIVCPYYDRCHQSKNGQARTINTDSNEGLRQKMKVHMELDASKEIYKKRKVIVEPVFGHIKNSGFRGFNVRGKGKVAGEFSLICAVHNIKKMVKAMMTGLVRPKFGNSPIQGV